MCLIQVLTLMIQNVFGLEKMYNTISLLLLYTTIVTILMDTNAYSSDLYESDINIKTQKILMFS